MNPSRYFPWLATGAAAAVLGATTYLAATAVPPQPGVPLTAAVNQAAVSQRYEQALSEVARELAPLLERELTAVDSAVVKRLYTRALGFTVPRSHQQRHLALVLALSRLGELLTPRRAVVAAAAPTVRSAQAELKQLINPLAP